MRPEWEIAKDEFLKRLQTSENELETRLRLPSLSRVARIIPLRHMGRVKAVVPVSKDLLGCVISKMTTLSGELVFPNSSVQLCKIDPSHLMVGQRFVYRENYQNLLEELPHLLGDFLISTGINDIGAYFIFGLDKDGLESMACYLPPLVENQTGGLVVMDGIHRSYITKQLGATMNAILITDVAIPFPCGTHPWSDVRVVSLEDKPQDIYERYFDLNKSLFRDLKYLGIDG